MNDFDLIHDIEAGKHFYQFYKSQDDLLKVMAPFWKAGVEKGDYCFWAVPKFLSLEETEDFLAREIPGFKAHSEKGGFELIAHANWFGDSGLFDSDCVLKRAIEKIYAGVAKGFSTVRAAGDLGGLGQEDWPSVQQCEARLHEEVKHLPCIILCSYPIHDLGLQETKDVLDRHDDVLVAKV